MDVQIRLVTEDDAGALTDLLRRNREFLAPWEPHREDGFFTEDAQRKQLRTVLDRHQVGTAIPLVITADQRLAGRITVNDIVRGAFQSAHLGYWVDQAHGGRGVATSAVAAAVRLAFDDLGLHRLQADTLEHNAASRVVLVRNGFTEIGRAPRYLRIAGRWQDHVLHQLLNEPSPAPASER
ncbi:GNAT family N-acetyltransferase [Jannaschia sp. R86511]|uniref:GNAT family N-acetyltransferase n=1 Tax=Jannaschia sp. R86511 TaxID=3093853 RepID=UPI0036D2192A